MKINFSRYKILIHPDSKKTQGLRVGDVVRRQYYDPPNLIYTLMIVLETGIEVIGDRDSAYFVGALIEGDEPKSGELLDFVRITNLFDTDRGGALYLTASDSEAPYMDVIDGLAVENSFCFPCMGGGKADVPDRGKYAVMGENCLDTLYTHSTNEATRIFRITRNKNSNTGQKLGLKQTLEKKVEHPGILIISYKIRASRPMENVPVKFGYTNDEETDGEDTIYIDVDWQYRLHLISVDYPPQYSRSFSIDLTGHLNTGDRLEIADLNIVLESDIAVFTRATKARVGKIKGIIDPVFGILEGYGAYFQNLYATKNVNIAGTLTAGDENGFSSTFYVGKIHKNIILNSIQPEFIDGATIQMQDTTPVGIGYAYRMGYTAKMRIQTAMWREEHHEKKYCFSFWAKSGNPATLFLYQDEHPVGEIDLDGTEPWRRYSVSFLIRSSLALNMTLRIDATGAGVSITAVQMEAGSTPSQYQPTDGTLSDTEDYGAWFSKGGIGGTIQNPLLKLNEDGSISSLNNSFVILPDGTGHFASGRFKWTKDTITLQDVTIRWEDLDGEAQENLLPKSVSLGGANVFHYPDELENRCEPDEIHIYATEHNFTAQTRKWQYLASDSLWKNLAGENKDFIKISPSGHYWEERNVLAVKYSASLENNSYEAVFTISKQFDGHDSYSVYIASTSGTVFKNGIISTTLVAGVTKGGVDITDKIPGNCFRWLRISEDAASDTLWNSAPHTGKTLEISGEDVWKKAVFDCEVIIST